MNTLWYDSETFSATPIKNGTYKYAENARIDIVSYAIDDGPVNVIDFTLDDPHDVWMLQDLLANAGTIIAHNAMFDRSVLRLGNLKIDIPIAKWRCSMVKALLHGLPGGLDKLCAILNVPQDLAKHKEGKALMMLFCKPLGKNRKLDVADRTTHPAEWARYLDYAKNDISAMREVWKRLPKWNYSEDNAGALERDLWHLDQKINDRGVPVDVPLVQAAIRATDDEQARLKEQVENHTDGYVHAATQRDKMLDFIFAEYGVAPQDLTKSSVAKLLEEDLDPMLRELLLIRQQASRSSTAKYAAFARGVNADDRLRGMLQFSGAARTRRDAGRTVQLQNLASRGLLKQNEIELGIEALMAGAEALVFDDVMQLTASTIRSVIAPKPGRKLVVADLANIEGRGLAWLAGEEWKLQAFRDYDEGRGPDLYKMAYAKSFGVSPDEVDAFGRQIGKTQELALGYAGGIGAFLTFSLAFGIDLDEMADLAWPALPQDVIEEAEDFIEWQAGQGRLYPISHRATVVCEVFKRLWRHAHPMTVRLWAELKDGFITATRHPSTTFRYRGLKFRRDGAWLRVQLPSGRALCYPHPEVDDSGQCSYMGVHQFTRKWTRIKTHGGKLAENCIAEGTPVLTDAGWVPIEQVTSRYRVWDGVAFVKHSGCFNSGKQVVSAVYGVLMTSEHRVLTEKGWRHASTCKGHNRAPCGLPDSDTLRRNKRSPVVVGDSLRLRNRETNGPVGLPEARAAGDSRFLRMHAPCDDRGAEDNARDVTTPRLRSMAGDGRPMPTANTPRLAQLRGQGHHRVQRVADLFRGFLERHGLNLRGGADTRTDGERRRLQQRELPMERQAAPGEQHPPEPTRGDARGAPDCRASLSPIFGERDDDTVSSSEWLADGAVVRTVWDIQDCGPRKRFVVQGSDGGLLIVHNCVQSLSRDVMFDRLQPIEAAGYPLIMRVHDEVITETPDEDTYNVDGLCQLLAIAPDWADGFPLAAAGFEGYRYRK